jgi:hypothetical protein
VTRITQVKKRDGRVVPFDPRRIADAIFRAAQSVGGEDRFLSEELAGVVGLYLERTHAGRVPRVEDVQAAIERVLSDTGHGKTARAFALHRTRRAAARGTLTVTGPDASLPLVGSDASDAVARWSKARIAGALVAEARLDPSEADEVARAVEGRVLSSGASRVSSSLVRALVDAELFARGHAATRERQRVVGLPKHDLLARLSGSGSPGRPADPQALAEAVGEEVLRQVALEDLLPREAAAAHRAGEIHVHDLGAPLRLSSVAPSTEEVLRLHLRGEGVDRDAGARRLGAALADACARYGPFAARVLALEDVNVHFAPFAARLDEDSLRAEVAELLLSSGVRSFPRRGGLLELELVLCAEVPDRLRRRPVPAPAPPGRTFRDYGDEALRAARAFLAAARDLRRGGAGDRLPALTLVLPPAPRDAAARALVHEALACAAESGEPRLVVERGVPLRGSRWHRLRSDEAPDPLRFDAGDVSAASTTSVDLAGAALRTAAGGVDAWLAEVDRMADLAVSVAASRRDVLRGCGDHPDGVLYGLERGPVPLVDVEGAAHVVDAVGASAGARTLLPAGTPEKRAALRALGVLRLFERAHAAAERADVRVSVVEDASPEASARLAQAAAARFPSAAPADPVGSFGGDVGALPDFGRRREPYRPRAGGSGEWRVRHRVGSDRLPPLETLVAAFQQSCADSTVVEHRVEPWPRRMVLAREGS